MFKLSVPLAPLTSDGGGAELPPIDQRPFKPGGDETPGDAQVRRWPMANGETIITQDAPAAPEQGPRDPAIDAMVAQWLSEGWLYVHAPSGDYRNRRSRWREMSEEERSWAAPQNGAPSWNE